jgi:hypothetical protein
MSLISEIEARKLWQDALEKNRWTKSKIRFAMFDWHPEMGKTSYRPAPAWPTVANSDNKADRAIFLSLVERILRQGDRFSSLGSAPRTGVRPELEFVPYPIEEQTIRQAILGTMKTIQPGAVDQEQILRSAFVAHLPIQFREAIGTRFSGFHPELATPSNTYTRTGVRPMRARYDIGFGHPRQAAGITGAIELKARKGSVASLIRPDKLNEACDEGEAESVDKDTLRDDFEKLLDPKLPVSVLRISWVVAGARSGLQASEIIGCLQQTLVRLSRVLGMLQPSKAVDSQTGWLKWVWADPDVTLHLAWYHPHAFELDRFEPAFGVIENE